MKKLTEREEELLEKMSKDPVGTVRTFEERMAFEHWWDASIEAAR